MRSLVSRNMKGSVTCSTRVCHWISLSISTIAAIGAFVGLSSHSKAADAPDTKPPVAALMKSIREFGVLPGHGAEDNAKHLQAAIDWAAPRGAALFVEPSDEPYPVAGGIVLRQNVSLIGVHGPVGRGTSHPSKPQPVGSVFAIEDQSKPFITVDGATQIRGIQFWYPKQSIKDPTAIIE